ncbi:MAG: hypothetical protein FWF57_08740 [Defluviitaleaceae bacterium]|nr:hypothetical protein [Defluviitaleaceae bacterium]
MSFEEELKKLEKEKSNLQSSMQNYVRYRSIVTLATIILYFYVDFVFLFVPVLLFIYLVIKHIQIKNKAIKTLYKLESIKRFISRQKGEWGNFEYNNEHLESINDTHPYTKDLDIFGKNSLYQFVNETNTYFGSKILTNILSNTVIIEEIKQRQESVKEISSKFDFLEEFKSIAKTTNSSYNPKVLIDYLENKTEKKYFFEYLSGLPILLITSILINFIFPSVFLIWIIFSILFLQLIVFAVSLPITQNIISGVSDSNNSLRNFKNLIKLIQNEPFNAKLNKEMQSHLQKNDKYDSVDFIKKLGFIEGAASFRKMGIFLFLLNILFLYDIQLVIILKKLKGKGDVKNWLETIGFFEAFISISTIPITFEDWEYPVFTNNLEIKFENMGHPLLHNPIKNNFNEKNISIITGSNMSGKTTFLRAIGVNLVLSYAGSSVNSKNFEVPILDIYTSMRTVDNLSENISTFYAELQRIKLIIDRAKEKRPMLFLIDEIFRGTNSEDRVDGAKMVLRQLQKEHIIGFITTHDLALCEIENEGSFENYNFKEYYEDGKIKFDYKINKGVSKTRNAKYLMKMVGIE